jgi:hypothetical protein
VRLGGVAGRASLNREAPRLPRRLLMQSTCGGGRGRVCV